MMAVFTTTQFVERETAFLESESQNGFLKANSWTQEKVAAYAQQLKALESIVNKKSLTLQLL